MNIQLIRLQHATIQVDLVLSQLENYPTNKVNSQLIRLQHATTQVNLVLLRSYPSNKVNIQDISWKKFRPLILLKEAQTDY